MSRKRAALLLGFVIIVGGWWITQGSSSARPEDRVVDVWATWGEEPDHLQALLYRYSQSSGVPVQITTQVRSDDLLKALADAEPPDLVILSNGDLVESYHQRGLVEPLDGWIQASGIDLDDMYPAPLAQCRGLNGATLCLPWGCDVDVLFWNKDLFEAAGLDPELPPQTMEELLEYASKLTIRDEKGELGQVGFIPDFPRSHAELYVRMFGRAFYRDEGAELVINSQPVIDALNWQRQFYSIYAPEDLEDFVSSFTPYMTSRHPLYAGRRLSCQQCHRSSPIQSNKTPDRGFADGKIAMMIDGQWQASLHALSQDDPQVNFGFAPFPPPAKHPEQANNALAQGPVVIVPAGARDKEAAIQLLAWMTSPEIVAEAAYVHSMLPTSRAAAADPRLQQDPNSKRFVGLMAHPSAKPAVTTPITPELNEALGRIEAELLYTGGDLVPLLNEVQAELVPKLLEALADYNEP
jgi:multiple sugar transport system substrate-binding protein